MSPRPGRSSRYPPAMPVAPEIGSPPDMSLAQAVTLADVRRAAERLAGLAHRTPVVTSRTLDRALGCSVFLKCENLQRVGAFKFRGATNALAALRERDPHAGVLTYSSGNHAQGVALAAALLGVRAVIVMPRNAPGVKLAATREYLAGAPRGSRVVLYDPAAEVREAVGGRIADEEGLAIVPPYDHPDVIAGQGTAALEFLEQAPDLDAVYVPCGGGGLLSGTAVASKGLAAEAGRTVRIVGAEPASADDAARSLRSGRLHAVQNPSTIADGARTPYLGRYTFALAMRHVDAMETVSEARLADGVLFALERLKLVVEPSGVLGLAALAEARREGRERAERVGVILSGGNLDPAIVPELIALRGGASVFG